MSGLYNLASTFGERVKTNLGGSLSSMSSQQWIRLVAIIGGYLLLRPYLIKLGARAQTSQLEKADAEDAAREAEDRAKLSPNELRGHRIAIPDDSDDDDEEGEQQPVAADWGKKARRRQRKMVRKMVEMHENKLADAEGEEDDKDIQEFLVD